MCERAYEVFFVVPGFLFDNEKGVFFCDWYQWLRQFTDRYRRNHKNVSHRNFWSFGFLSLMKIKHEKKEAVRCFRESN